MCVLICSTIYIQIIRWFYLDAPKCCISNSLYSMIIRAAAIYTIMGKKFTMTMQILFLFHFFIHFYTSFESARSILVAIRMRTYTEGKVSKVFERLYMISKEWEGVELITTAWSAVSNINSLCSMFLSAWKTKYLKMFTHQQMWTRKSPPVQPQSKLHCSQIVAPVRVNHAQMHARVHTHTPTSQTHDNECLERVW